MRSNIIIMTAFIIIGLGLYSYYPTSQKIDIEKINPRQTSNIAPNFSFKSLDNKKYELKNFKGKLVIIHFWASWCAPCVVELPSLIKLGRDYPNDIVILAFSNDNDSESALRFLKKQMIKLHDTNIIWSWDKNKAITYDIFQTIMLPETIILDRNLNMVKKYVGDTKWNSAEIRAELDQILKAK
jgi:thiol-disulfide isomerase/thioredoxin